MAEGRSTGNVALKARPGDRAIRTFIEKAKALPFVVGIWVASEGRLDRLWTIVQAPSWDDLDPLFEAQGAVYEMFDEPVVGFRVINLADFSDGKAEDFVPVDATRLYP